MSKAERAQSQQLKSCVLILGMHRSGTSALAGVLSKLGCDLPATPMPASTSNEKGFFESSVIKEFNDELLASAGSSWDDFTEFHKDWLSSPQAGKFLDRAVSTLEAELTDSRLFVLKDPRICRIVPFWIEALERFGCVVKPVLNIRNPLDIGHSLLSKRGMSEPVSQMVWLRHALDAEHATRGMARFHTSFEQLMQGWEIVARRAGEKLHLAWPKSVSSVEFEVSDFLSGDLRHHKESPERTVANDLLPQWLRQTYDILERWAEHGELTSDYPELDRIKAEFDAASAAFSRLVRAERIISAEQRKKSEELKLAVKTAQTELEGLAVSARKDRAELDNLLQASTTERASLAKSLEEERAFREALNETLQEQSSAAESVRAALEEQLQTAMAETDRLRAALENQEEIGESRQAELEAELAAVRATSEEEVGALKSSLQEQRRRATLMDAEFYQLKEALEALEFQLAQSRSELAEHRARRKEASRVIARRDAEIEARFQELALLQRQILQSSLSWRIKYALKRLTAVNRSEHSRAVTS